MGRANLEERLESYLSLEPEFWEPGARRARLEERLAMEPFWGRVFYRLGQLVHWLSKGGI